MVVDKLLVEDLQRGYVFSAEAGCYTCISCGRAFEEGEIYPLDGRLLEAARAIRLHMELEHGDYLARLIDGDCKYNTLTENQRQLFHCFAAGMPDKEIAREMGVSASTVRHQKFMFREKAKQARMYLALYERVLGDSGDTAGGMMPIHEHAKMVDERYVVTEEERRNILETSFSSLEPLRLKALSPKEKKKVVVLSEIARVFQTGTEYTEKQVNELLREVYEDYATIRRYLIQYGFMKRTNDCSKYWLT